MSNFTSTFFSFGHSCNLPTFGTVQGHSSITVLKIQLRLLHAKFMEMVLGCQSQPLRTLQLTLGTRNLHKLKNSNKAKIGVFRTNPKKKKKAMTPDI